jgi:hypothetical protein
MTIDDLKWLIEDRTTVWELISHALFFVGALLVSFILPSLGSMLYAEYPMPPVIPDLVLFWWNNLQYIFSIFYIYLLASLISDWVIPSIRDVASYKIHNFFKFAWIAFVSLFVSFFIWTGYVVVSAVL